MKAALVVVGRGDTPGIQSEAFQLNLSGMAEDADTGAPSLHANVQKWAAVPQRAIPPSSRHVLFKVSRHQDSVGNTWTWIGTYVGAAFAGENRGGHYTGIGIAFAEHVASSNICKVLNDLLDHFLIDMTSNGLNRVISGSVNKWRPHSHDLDALAVVQFTKLPEKFGGVQPGMAKAVQITWDDWSVGALSEKVSEILSNSDYDSVSSVLLVNWDTPADRCEFYDATSTVGQSGVHQRLPAEGAAQTPMITNARPRPVEESSQDSAEILELKKRLAYLERRLDEISRAWREPVPEKASRRDPDPQRVMIGLIVTVLVIQTLALGAQLLHLF